MHFQFGDHAGSIFCPESAYENVRALKIGRHIDRVNADQRAFKINFTRNNAAEFTFHEFVHA